MGARCKVPLTWRTAINKMTGRNMSRPAILKSILLLRDAAASRCPSVQLLGGLRFRLKSLARLARLYFFWVSGTDDRSAASPVVFIAIWVGAARSLGCGVGVGGIHRRGGRGGRHGVLRLSGARVSGWAAALLAGTASWASAGVTRAAPSSRAARVLVLCSPVGTSSLGKPVPAKPLRQRKRARVAECLPKIVNLTGHWRGWPKCGKCSAKRPHSSAG